MRPESAGPRNAWTTQKLRRGPSGRRRTPTRSSQCLEKRCMTERWRRVDMCVTLPIPDWTLSMSLILPVYHVEPVQTTAKKTLKHNQCCETVPPPPPKGQTRGGSRVLCTFSRVAGVLGPCEGASVSGHLNDGILCVLGLTRCYSARQPCLWKSGVLSSLVVARQFKALSSNSVKSSLVITCQQDPLYNGGILAAPSGPSPSPW